MRGVAMVPSKLTLLGMVLTGGDVRVGIYQVQLSREGFQTHTIPGIELNTPVIILELTLRESDETVPAARCSSGVPGTPCAPASASPGTRYPGVRSPASQEPSSE